MTLLSTESQHLEDGRARASGPKKYAPGRGILDGTQHHGTAVRDSITNNNSISVAGWNLSESRLTSIRVV